MSERPYRRPITAARGTVRAAGPPAAPRQPRGEHVGRWGRDPGAGRAELAAQPATRRHRRGLRSRLDGAGGPRADLALALAVASSQLDRPLPAGIVAIGEVGLAGEIRPVRGVSRRLSEAARLGFTHALVPPESGRDAVPRIHAGLRVLPVGDIATAIRTAVR